MMRFASPFFVTFTFVAATLTADAVCNDATSDMPRKSSPSALSRWQDMRFGMFIHWGPVSITEKEIGWSRANSNPKCPNHGPTSVAVYDRLYEQFNPAEFNAREWVATAKASGMKYMILTARHHDGFLLWESKVSDYNIMHSPLKRDICRELSQAAHEAGISIGWYFSPPDWHDPDCRRANNDAFVARMQAELAELLTNYGKIDILWFDTDGGSSPWRQAATYAMVRRLQPDIVIDERLDHGIMAQYKTKRLSPWADFYTPEQNIGGFDNADPWESCMTISAHNQWSWGGHQDGVKSLEKCMEMLIRCAGGNGNLLLNVGPMPSGKIASEQADRIKQMGPWLEKNGETIYGTRGGPFKPGAFGVSTHKGNTIYLHVLHWPSGNLELPNVAAKIVRSSARAGGEVSLAKNDNRISISLPAAGRQPLDTIIELTLDRPASEIKPIDTDRSETAAR